MAAVLCDNCETEPLEWCEEADAGRGAFLCPRWPAYEQGAGCARLVAPAEYRERQGGLDGEEEKEGKEDGDGEEEEEEEEGEEDEEEAGDGEESGEEEENAGERRRDKTKSENVAALLRGDLVVTRQALLPKVLSVGPGGDHVRQAFKSPCPGGQGAGAPLELARRLCARKRFVPWGAPREACAPLVLDLPELTPVEEAPAQPQELPPDVLPLVLWESEEVQGDGPANSITVDPHLVRFLRPHQRDGVQFMFECVAGLRDFGTEDCCGCILADDMGLGKTLQSITLLWTLLCQGFDGSPMVNRAIIVTPTSLVSNWESEITKWLENRVNVLAMCESTRADVLSGIASFLTPRNHCQVLIISYETFRMHAKKFQKEGTCDLLICDEAHRLKNDRTLTNQALGALHCRRRVLLSGTPMQNDLEEFYAMVNFTNPGVLGDAAAFRRYYEAPILRGREPDAEDRVREIGAERSAELSELVNQFILRRTNALLSNHLPPKLVEVVCCKMTDLQTKLYRHFIHSKNVRQALEDKTKRARVLASITALKKLCNHPKLIYDTLRAGGSETAGFEDCMQFFPEEIFSSRGSCASSGSWIELSGKMAVLARLLANLRQHTDDRIVLVSNYTQTLDLFAQICQERGYPYVQLDGTTSISKRQKLVKRFNDPTLNEFAFLLSSKAGGCGLNLIGGNRLVLFDPDWNPANDKQAAARVWRDGQKKRVFIYRFLATGTIEEKVYQRQMSKEGLQKVVDKEQSNDAKSQVNALSSEDLRDLFKLRDDIRSDTHETLNCKRCNKEIDPTSSGSSGSDSTNSDPGDGDSVKAEVEDIGSFAKVAGCMDILRPWEKQIGTPSEEDLKSWAHHESPSTIPDTLFQMSAGNEVSFAFTCQIDGKLTPIESFGPRTSSAKLGLNAKAPPNPPVARILPLSKPIKYAQPQHGPGGTLLGGGLHRRPLKSWNAVSSSVIPVSSNQPEETRSIGEENKENSNPELSSSKRAKLSSPRQENAFASRTGSPS